MNPWWKKTISGVVTGTSVLAGVLVATYIFFEVFTKIKNTKSEEQLASEEEVAE